MGKGRKERKMPIGDTARSVIWEYLQEREALMPRTEALWVSEQGEALLPNDMPDIEASGQMGQHRRRASPPFPPFLCHQCPQGWDAGAGTENSRRLEEDSRDLFQDVGGRGRQGVSPAGEPMRPSGACVIGTQGAAAAGSAAWEAVRPVCPLHFGTFSIVASYQNLGWRKYRPIGI